MKGERSWVFGSSNRTRRNKDGRREGEECIGLANTKVCQGRTKVLRISELFFEGFVSISRLLHDMVKKDKK